MLLVLLALVLLAGALVVPAALESMRARRSAAPSRAGHPPERVTLADPGRERRAEQRARELLRSCVNDEEWSMYRDLGFIRVFGRPPDSPFGPRQAGAAEALAERSAEEEPGTGGDEELPTPTRPHRGGARARRPADDPTPSAPGSPKPPTYAYLLYPHKPVLAYESDTHKLLSEYCVEFPDLSDAVTGSRLPDSDDVLAKWMALTGDEDRLLREANMHLPGRQLDPGRVRRDLWRLGEWERRRPSAGSSSQ